MKAAVRYFVVDKFGEEYYETMKIQREVDGARSIEMVEESIWDIVKEYLDPTKPIGKLWDRFNEVKSNRPISKQSQPAKGGTDKPKKLAVNPYRANLIITVRGEPLLDRGPVELVGLEETYSDEVQMAGLVELDKEEVEEDEVDVEYNDYLHDILRGRQGAMRISQYGGSSISMELSSESHGVIFWRLLELSKAINRAGVDLGLPIRGMDVADGRHGSGWIPQGDGYDGRHPEPSDKALYRPFEN
ncbi:hypothetical protein BY996DRAFT_6504788 [Phakopsora pachyrhizi]|nr:hypothetical protein BY996DRAFT_6504788 [Phakopsora pachyrhizi]